jgi:hypothetical protein
VTQINTLRGQSSEFFQRRECGVCIVITALCNVIELGLISYLFFLSLCLYSPLDLGRFFSVLILYTVGRTPWTRDQPVARPLPTQTQTQNKPCYTSVSSSIAQHHPSFRAEDISCDSIQQTLEVIETVKLSLCLTN